MISDSSHVCLIRYQWYAVSVGVIRYQWYAVTVGVIRYQWYPVTVGVIRYPWYTVPVGVIRYQWYAVLDKVPVICCACGVIMCQWSAVPVRVMPVISCVCACHGDKVPVICCACWGDKVPVIYCDCDGDCEGDFIKQWKWLTFPEGQFAGQVGDVGMEQAGVFIAVQFMLSMGCTHKVGMMVTTLYTSQQRRKPIIALPALQLTGTECTKQPVKPQAKPLLVTSKYKLMRVE